MPKCDVRDIVIYKQDDSYPLRVEVLKIEHLPAGILYHIQGTNSSRKGCVKGHEIFLTHQEYLDAITKESQRRVNSIKEALNNIRILNLPEFPFIKE